MADNKLTDLAVLTSAASGDLLYIVDIANDISKQITVSNLTKTFFVPEYVNSSYTINWNNGKEQYLALNGGASAITFQNPVGNTHYTLILKQPLSGVAGTLIFASSTILWASGVTPTLTTANSGIDALFLIYSTTLGRYLGSLVNDFK